MSRTKHAATAAADQRKAAPRARRGAPPRPASRRRLAAPGAARKGLRQDAQAIRLHSTPHPRRPPRSTLDTRPSLQATALGQDAGLTALGPEAGATLNNRQRFLAACHCRPVDRPPIWLMRQAGRALPEYRALKQKHRFLELVQTPELAAEVTLQPIRRFDFDAAILFSDILIVAEAMGQRYHFRESGGIQMDFLLQSAADIERLEESAVTDKLQYVARALRLIKSALGARTALIGFAGAPWTLANFMLEGAGVREYSRAKELFFTAPLLFNRLLEKLTRAVTRLLQLQIDAGVDAVQIFDSLGGGLPASAYAPASARWTKQIIASLKTEAPVIVFAKGAHGSWRELAATGARVLGLDCNVRLADVRAQLRGSVAVQGNLDPFLLRTTPQAVAAQTRLLLSELGGQPGHVFNLGHGVPPDAKLENLEALVRTVRTFQPGRANHAEDPAS